MKWNKRGKERGCKKMVELELLEERRIFLGDERRKKELQDFLSSQNIRLDKNLEYTVGIYEKEELIATGSIFKNTLRCIAVKEEYQGSNLLNKIMSHLINEQYQRGNTHIFIYTKPEAAKSFTYLGFYEIIKTKDVVLMENEFKGIENYVKDLEKKKIKAKKIASIVMNGNPFTKGHAHLIECAAKENDIVHVFVVSEEASVLPFSVRYDLIKKGTNHLKNVILHKGGNYIISSATFPSYFIKDEKETVDIHATLDLSIFTEYIAKALEINSRYVGEEPYCEVTKAYNERMKTMLKENGITCNVIPRLELKDKAISASRVREAIKENQIETIKNLVPETTYTFFQSEEGKTLIEKIQKYTGRH